MRHRRTSISEIKRARALISRRSLLGQVVTLAATGSVAMAAHKLSPSTSMLFSPTDPATQSNPLKEHAAAKGLIYGAATSRRALFSDQAFAAAFAKQCGMLVTERDLQWAAIRPSQDTFDFGSSDKLLAFAQEHNLLFRGTSLLWHDRLPSWFRSGVSRHNARQVLEQHVSKVVEHFAGKVHSWDVVNEGIALWDKRSDGLRNSPWLQLVGPDYVEHAFREAHRADPKAMLSYNENRLVYDNPDDIAKRPVLLRLLEKLKSKEVPIHALGIQAHLRTTERVNSAGLARFLREVADLGLKIIISELDVTDSALPADPRARDRAVADIYSEFLSVVLPEPAVIAIITWGFSDRYTWLQGFAPRSDHLPVRPLPFDSEIKPKLAWRAIASAFDKAPKR